MVDKLIIHQSSNRPHVHGGSSLDAVQINLPAACVLEVRVHEISLVGGVIHTTNFQFSFDLVNKVEGEDRHLIGIHRTSLRFELRPRKWHPSHIQDSAVRCRESTSFSVQSVSPTAKVQLSIDRPNIHTDLSLIYLSRGCCSTDPASRGKPVESTSKCVSVQMAPSSATKSRCPRADLDRPNGRVTVDTFPLVQSFQVPGGDNQSTSAPVFALWEPVVGHRI